MRDLNDIQCACTNDSCEIGIRFDSDPCVLIFQDKHGKDTIMQLNIENIDQLIKELKGYKKVIKKQVKA